MTYEYREIVDGTSILVATPFRKHVDEMELKKVLKRFHIRLGEKREINRVLDDILGWEFR